MIIIISKKKKIKMSEVKFKLIFHQKFSYIVDVCRKIKKITTIDKPKEKLNLSFVLLSQQRHLVGILFVI